MKNALQKLFLGALTAGFLLLGATARLGLSDLGLEQSNGRGLLQDEEPEPCLFLNGRIIPPCDQLDGEESPETDVAEPEVPAVPDPEVPDPDTPSSAVDVNLEPLNQTEIIMECRLNGSLAAPEAAFVACEALAKACKFPPSNQSTAVTALSDDPSEFLSQIIDNSCRIESIATCESKGREFAAPECASVLVNGPVENGTVCDGIRAANEIFESEVSLSCSQQFTPQDN